MKNLQKVIAWNYPCDGKYYFDSNENFLKIDYIYSPMKTRKSLVSDECNCGKNCKPQKIEIIVRRAK